jgi:hypothetical protein
MTGVTIIETEKFNALIHKIESIHHDQQSIIAELSDARKPYLTSEEVMELLNRGKTWLNDNKHLIGFSKATGTLLFKRKDLETFINSDYFKA